MQPQNWRKCRCTHCNFRALTHIRNKGFKNLFNAISGCSAGWRVCFCPLQVEMEAQIWWKYISKQVNLGVMLYLYRFCGLAAEWSQQDSYSALLWPSRDTCCHSRRCSPHRSLQGNRYSQSDKPCGNIHRRCRLGPFNSSHRNDIHAHWCYIKKQEKWNFITVGIHFSG